MTGLIPPGQRWRCARSGEAVRRYNQIIGIAKTDIAPGQHVLAKSG